MKTLFAKYNILFTILFLFSGYISSAQCSLSFDQDTTICLESAVDLGPLVNVSGAGPIVYEWSTATGLSCTDCPNPIATPLVTTTYTLTITDNDGCTLTDSITVTIAPVPVAAFSFSPNNVCASTPIQFSSTSSGSGLSYSWNFGNPASGGQNTSTQSTPSHTFVSTGPGSANFNVVLTVTNNFGCQDTVTNTVAVNQTPDASLIDPVSLFKNCDGSNFNLTVYDNSFVTGVNHQIIWGDGTPDYTSGTAPTGGFSHVYTTSDIFDLDYIITGANGCSDTASYLVSNIANPAIGAANPGSTSGCGPLVYCFPLSSYSANHPSTYYIVDYGDSSPNDTLPHPPPATLCHSYTETSCGQPGNSFTFSIQAINQCDNSEASISPIRVYIGPVSNFSTPQTNYCVNTAVPFINLSTLGFNANCETTTLFNWDFGDGTTLTAFTLTNPSHVYTIPGTYTVTLSATNNCATTTHSLVVCIEEQPVPDFIITPDGSCVPFTAVATNLSTLLSICDLDTLWNITFIQSACIPDTGSVVFTNGTNSTSENPEFLISNPGEYNIRLNLTNSCGTFFHEQIVLGQAPPQVILPPLASVCEGASVSPTATLNDCYEPSDNYLWTFTGGAPASSTSLVPGLVTYSTAGSYSVNFAATNACGTTNVSAPITIFAPPVTDAGPDTSACSNISVGIGSIPVGGVTYSWTPTAGLNNDSIANPTVTVTNLTGAPVDYSFVVTASTSANCFTRDTVIVTIYPLPALVVNSPTICIGEDTAMLVSGAEVGGTYSWSPATNLSCTNCDNPTANPTITTSYTITGTSSQGCINTTSTTVTVNPLPIVDVGPDMTLCDQPVPVVLNGTPVGGTWSGSPNVTSGGTFNPSGIEVAQIIYEYTDGITNCFSSDTLIVSVNPLITPTVDPLDSICINASVVDLNTVFNPSNLGGIWSGTGVTNPNFNPTNAGVGTHTLTYTLGSGTCQTSVTTDIEVNPTPVLVTSDETICFGDDIQLNISGAGTGGSYTWSPITGLSCANCDNPIANPGNTSIYTITGTTSQGCSADINSTVTVNPLTVINAGPDLNLCDQPIPVVLNGTPVGGTWTGSANINAGGTFTPNGTEVSNLIYSYTDASTNCSNSDTLIVTVNPPIIPTLNPSDSICINAVAVDLNTVFSPSTLGGIWSGTGVTNPNFNPTNAGVGTHTLTYTLGSGTCQTSVTTDIEVNPTPVLVTSDETICFGDDIQLNISGAGTGGSYTWSPITGLSCANCDNPIANPGNTSIYTITGTTSQGCSADINSTVTVNPLPVINAGPDLNLCDQPIPVVLNGTPVGGTWTGSANINAGGTFTPNGTEVSNLIYSYTDASTNCSNSDTLIVTVNPPIIPTLNPSDSICINAVAVDLNTVFSPSTLGGIWSGTGVTNPNFNPTNAGVGTHTLTYTLGSGTCQTSVTTDIEVNPTPVLVTSDETICFGDDIQLNISGAGTGGSYSWSPAIGLSCTNCDNPIANPGNTSIYTITGTTSQGCSADINSTVTVNPLPVINAGPDLNLCDQPIPVVLNGTPVGGTWTGSANINAGGTFTPNGTEVSNLIYSYTDASTNCSNSDTLIVTVNPPIIPTLNPSDSICINAVAVDLNTVFSPSTLGGIWSGTGVSSPNFNPTTAGVGVHTMTYTLGTGTCQTSVTADIEVNPQPTIVSSDETICFGGNIQLGVNGAGTGGSYSWSPAIGLSCTNCDNPIANPVSTSVYTITGTTMQGCSNSTTSTVSVNPLPIVDAGVDTSICNLPSPVQLNGSPVGGVWSGLNISPSGVFTPSGTGSFTVTYTYTLGTGCVDSSSRIVTVLDPTPSDAGIDLEACIGSATVALNGLPTGGTWAGSFVTSGGVFNPSTSGFYDLIYSTGAGNCLTIDSMEFTVHDLPIVDAGTDVGICISAAAFDLSGAPVGGAWSGTGITDVNLGTFAPAVATVGAHTITYTVADPITACVNTDNVDVTVNPLPVVDFVVDSLICINTAVNFTNNSTLAFANNWGFGDGGSSIVSSPTYTYSATGLYAVTLVVTSANGCVDSLNRSVSVLDFPNAQYTFNPAAACGPVTASFTNTSTGIANTYQWDFGNGTSSTLQDPLDVNYIESNFADTTYTIELNATNYCGSDSHTEIITVEPTPTAVFGTDFDTGCAPFEVNIANTSIGSADTYYWDFGDGTTSTTSSSLFQHTYYTGNTSTSYTITLVAENNCGSDTATYVVTATPILVDAFFNTSLTSGCAPLTLDFTQYTIGGTQYGWDFDDGNVSTVYSPTHTFTTAGTYNVSLSANDGCGYDTTTVTITVHPEPTIDFTSNPTTVCVNETIDFTNLSVGIAGVNWDFGDGNSSVLVNPSHSYTSSGVYNVVLSGTSQTYGCFASVNHPVTVSVTPIAQFTPNPTNGCIPLDVQMNNTSINANFYYWDFGDGNTSNLQSPNHTYTVDGTYTIRLIVENLSGCTDTIEVNVTAYPLPGADFVIDQPSVCLTTGAASFTNLSTGAVGYSWDFGNGQSSVLTNPSLNYTSAGTYTVTLTATNQYGCISSLQRDLSFYDYAAASYDIPITESCSGNELIFNSTSTNTNSVEWIFGNSESAIGNNVSYSYPNQGTYTVTMIAYGGGGCNDTLIITQPIVINPTPVADFNYENIIEINKWTGLVGFYNLSTDASSYTWYFGDGGTSNSVDPEHSYNTQGNFNVTLIASNNFGCSDTIVKPIVVELYKGLYLANAMCPGHTDFNVSHFVPIGVGLKEFELLIFDDWGNLIWSTNALDANGRPTEAWDGTFQGVPVQQDAYVWKVNAVFLDDSVWEGKEYAKNKIKKSGTVTVIR